MAVRLSALLTCRPQFPLVRLLIFICQRPTRPQVLTAVGNIKSTEKFNYLIWNRTHYLPACSTVSQQSTLPRAPLILRTKIILCFPLVMADINFGRIQEGTGSRRQQAAGGMFLLLLSISCGTQFALGLSDSPLTAAK
jgi:hypothetical protein